MNKGLETVVSLAIRGEISLEDIQYIDKWFESHSPRALETFVERYTALLYGSDRSEPQPREEPSKEPNKVFSDDALAVLGRYQLRDLHQLIGGYLVSESGSSAGAYLPFKREGKMNWARRVAAIVGTHNFERALKSLLRSGHAGDRESGHNTTDGRGSHTGLLKSFHAFRKETGRTVAQISDDLVPDLSLVTGLDATILAARYKEGLERWVSRLSRLVPPSLLLHGLSRMRSKYVKTTPSHWPLKESSNL